MVAGTLSIAAFATAARALLPGVLGDLRSRHPLLSVSSSEMEPHESIPALQRGQLDLTIVQDWTDDSLTLPDNLSVRHLIDDRFDVALPVDHPLADRKSVAITDLADDDWISWSTGQICHDWLVRTLGTNGTPPRIRHTASGHSTQLALTAAGFGVAVLPRLGREPAPATVRFVSIDPPPSRRIFAVWRASATARPSISAALQALQQVCHPDRTS